MTLRSMFIRIPQLIIYALAFLVITGVAPAQTHKTISQLTINSDTAVRILFSRPNANYVLPPLIFRIGEMESPKLNTAPVDHYGRSPYISLPEMKALIHQLEGNRMIWQVSSSTAPIQPFEQIAPNEDLFITVYATNGMAISTIPPKRFCEVLSQLNNAIKTKRAHWELEYFRSGCGCQVLGYKSDAYPNDR